MTERVKLLTCDRCGTKAIVRYNETGDHYERYPEGWSAVAYNCKVVDLCPICSNEHESFMKLEK